MKFISAASDDDGHKLCLRNAMLVQSDKAMDEAGITNNSSQHQ